MNPTWWQIFKALHSAVFCNTFTKLTDFYLNRMQTIPVATTAAVIITAALHFVCTKKVTTVMLAEPLLL